jgi:hypothetical protein
VGDSTSACGFQVFADQFSSFNAEEGQEEVGCAQRKSRSEGMIRCWRLLMKTDSIKANQERGQK